MKAFSLTVFAGILILALVSCAGAPESDTGTVPETSGESDPVEITEDDSPAEPVSIWKAEWETTMSPDGTVDKNIEYRYDESGNLSRISEHDSRDELLYLRNYNYENGFLVSQEMSDRYGLVSTTLYETDSEGMVTRETKQDPLGTNLSIVDFEYENGLVTRSIASDGEGTPLLSAEYSYIDNMIVLVEYLLPGGKEEARFTRTLDNGRAVEEQTVLPDGTVESGRVFEYEGDVLIREIHSAAGNTTKSVRYDYDGDGNIIRETWTNRNGRDYEILERRWILIEEPIQGGAS